MTEVQASRTLVKSAPELWAECSDAPSLGRHLDGFGEIRITRLDPETAVAWEGELARGTVRIEPAGWGTKVILTAVAVGEDVALVETVGVGGEVVPVEVVPVEVEEVTPGEEAPFGVAEVVARAEVVTPSEVPPTREAAPPPKPMTERPRRGRLGRLLAWLRGPDGAPEPEPDASEPPPRPPPAPEAESPPSAETESPPTASSDPPSVDPAAATLDAEAALTAALDSLGQAHHRPYSRA